MTEQKEIERLSIETGVSASEIEANLKEIGEKGYDEEAALAIWKSEHSMMLGGEVADVAARVLFKDGPQHREGDRGEYDVLYVYLFAASADNTIDLYSLALYNERMAIGDNLKVGKTYDLKAKLFPGSGNRMASLRLIGDEIKESTRDFPSVEELVTQYGVHSVSEIENYIGVSSFFTGVVGRVFETGFEMSVSGINPIAVFIKPEDLSKIQIGKKPTVYGYVSQREDGRISISARGVL